MTVADVIVADEIPVGSAEPHGIFYKIRQIVTNNNILNYVEPTTNHHDHGDINSVVKWDGLWQGYSQNVYVLIDFKDRFIFPTHYSLKGYKDKYFAKEWALYGLNSTNGSPVEISRNSCVGSTFCGDPSTCGSVCCNDDWGTFMINSPTRAYRYLKMTSLVSSTTIGWWMALKGFEVFGILSKDGRTQITRNIFRLKSCPMNCHFPVYIFFCFYQLVNEIITIILL
jgi:hypothetical protein